MIQPATSLPIAWENRPHRSTCVFVAVLFLFMLAVNVSGDLVLNVDLSGKSNFGPYFSASHKHFEHGWPFCYLLRSPIELDDLPPKWWAPWDAFGQPTERFHWLGLLADLAIAVGILLSSGLLFEVWRRSRHRVYQFFLRDLFVFLALFAILGGLLAAHRSAYRDELQTLRTISRLEQLNKGGSPPVWWRGGPSWLRQFVGDRAFAPFDRVVEIDATDVELEYVTEFKQLRVLAVHAADSNLSGDLLEKCSQLEALDLKFLSFPVDSDGREPTDAEGNAIKQFFRMPRLPRLRGLNLAEAAFRGDGLTNVPSLEVLELMGTDIDDRAMGQLANLACLRYLGLSSTRITNEGLRHLSALKNLAVLELAQTCINDQGLCFLVGMPNLRAVFLDGCGITDAAIPILKQLTTLNELRLQGTQVTAQGLLELKASLPKCDVGP